MDGERKLGMAFLDLLGRETANEAERQAEAMEE